MDDFADDEEYADVEENTDGTAIDTEEDSTAADEYAEETDSTAVVEEAEREAEEDAALTSG